MFHYYKISLEDEVVGRKDIDVILMKIIVNVYFRGNNYWSTLDVGDNLLIDRYRENEIPGSQFIFLEEDGGGRLLLKNL